MYFKKVTYAKLNARQKENYNFQKVSAILADYGFATIRLSDDWQGADFIALHIDRDILRVQLKSRLTFEEKYKGKDLYIVFGYQDEWYLYPHDTLLAKILEETKIGSTISWADRGGYSFGKLSKQLLALLAPYKIQEST